MRLGFVLLLTCGILSAWGNSISQVSWDSISFLQQKVLNTAQAGRLDSAEYFRTLLKARATNPNDYTELLGTYRSYGFYLEQKGYFEKSIELYLDGLKLAEEYKDDNWQSKLLTDLSQAYRIFHDYDRAIEYAKEAYKIVIDDLEEDVSDRSEAKSMIAAAFTEMGRPDSALHYHLEAISYIGRLDSTRLKSNMINLGYAYMELGQLEECRFWTEKGLSFYLPLKDPYSLGSIYTNLAMYGNRANKFDYALQMFDSAIHYTQLSNYVETYFWIYEERAEVFKKMGHHDLARRDLEVLLQIKDSVFSAQRDHTAQDMEAKYQTERKEQQIVNQKLLLAEQEAINQRNVIFIIALTITLILILIVILLYRSRLRKKHQLTLQRKDTEAQKLRLTAAIASQEEERKRFAVDLHDGFGQMISILKMNVASLKKSNITPDERHQIFDKSKEMLDEMYDELRGICFNLMPQTLINNGLVEALKEFVRRINVAGTIRVELMTFDMDERLVDLHEISLYRIVQEWMNNMLKYSDASEVTIQLTRDEQEITLLIEDNGRGFDKGLLLNSKGNGWKNIGSRSNLIAAEVEVDTKPGQVGSTLIVNVPLNRKVNQVASV